jgi:hypothetical protein
MCLVEIEVVRADAAQALVHRRLDVEAIEGHAPGAHRTAEPAAARPRHLARHDDGIPALALEPLAADLLRAAGGRGVGRHGVDLGDVDEVDACVVGLVEAGEAGGLVGHAAEGHRPQTDLGDGEAGLAEHALLHGGSSTPRGRRRDPPIVDHGLTCRGPDAAKPRPPRSARLRHAARARGTCTKFRGTPCRQGGFAAPSPAEPGRLTSHPW